MALFVRGSKLNLRRLFVNRPIKPIYLTRQYSSGELRIRPKSQREDRVRSFSDHGIESLPLFDGYPSTASPEAEDLMVHKDMRLLDPEHR